MSIWLKVVAAVVAVIVAPLIGGLLKGIDRKITAHMQGRIGPPIQQPFYDLLKLWGKDRIVTTKSQLLFAYGYLILVVTAVVLYAIRQDLVMLLFVLAFGGVCLVLGALSVRSPYSQFGGHRELLQLLSYEPILILAAVAIYVETGGFLIEDIFARGSPLLPNLWIAFIALLIALAIVMRKSPFDISASDHAHQEIVRGVLTEYSGPYLAIIELTHWYELTLLLGILGLFWIVGGMWWISIILPLFCFLLMLILDNISARLTWSWMVRFSWSFGLILVTLNILFVHLQWM